LLNPSERKAMAVKCPKYQSNNPEIANLCADFGTKLISYKSVDLTATLEIPKKRTHLRS